MCKYMIFFVYISHIISTSMNFNVDQKVYLKPENQIHDELIISSHTRKILRYAGYHPQKRTFNEKYRKMKYRKNFKKTQSIRVSVDYACLQNLGLVRHFIQKKYKISIEELEYYLFVYSLNMFTKKDHGKFPSTFGTRTINSLLNRGVLVTVLEGVPRLSRKQVYKLSKEHTVICKRFYEYLHEEKTIPELEAWNVLFAKGASVSAFRYIKGVNTLNKKITGAEETKLDDKIYKATRKQKENHSENRKASDRELSKAVKRKRKIAIMKKTLDEKALEEKKKEALDQ